MKSEEVTPGPGHYNTQHTSISFQQIQILLQKEANKLIDTSQNNVQRYLENVHKAEH